MGEFLDHLRRLFSLPPRWMAAQTNAAPAKDHSLGNLMRIFALGLLCGALGLYLAYQRGLPAAIGIGVLIFLAAFATGCFLGFLFGVPRVLSGQQSPGSGDAAVPPPGAAPDPGAPSGTTAKARLLQSNTNLERISDWLTTMLVGASLVELHHLNDGLVSFRDFLDHYAVVFTDAAGQTTAGVIPVVGPVVLIFGLACGFLFMYLNTRLVLTRLFHSVEVDLSRFLSASDQESVKAIASSVEDSHGFVYQRIADRPVSDQDALNLMFDLLYKGDPGKVIELGRKLESTSLVQRGDFWFYLAAAFGQKLHALDPGSDDWKLARRDALDCGRRAVAIADVYRARLWNISDPGSHDDDLAPLRDDPDFRRLVQK